jgi:biotin-dependent carboxylase-like uncharacterized protein
VIATLRVISGGLLSSVQDSGRLTTQRYGVPVGGAMDTFALAAANRLLANPASAAAIEITSGGAIFEVLTRTLLALTGAELRATLNDNPIPTWTAVLASPGAQLHIQGRRASWGARAYLALAGGLDVPLVLGSRSTYIAGGFGGLEGRALRAGDILMTAEWPHDPDRMVGRRWPDDVRPAYQPQPSLRFLPGPHDDCFIDEALETFQAQPFRVSNDSNRMGYRLEGPKIRYARPCNLPSLGVIPGVVQVPPDGAPILLMADAQTTGGYPIVGVVIEPDLPLAAQLLPGDSLRFQITTIDAAYAAQRMVKAWRETMLEEESVTQFVALTGAIASEVELPGIK